MSLFRDTEKARSQKNELKGDNRKFKKAQKAYKIKGKRGTLRSRGQKKRNKGPATAATAQKFQNYKSTFSFDFS